jgi:hypothetical protein
MKKMLYLCNRNKYNKKQMSMLERLKICWYVLTRHTYAVFFCSKDLKHQECYEKNTFDVFNQSIVEFVSENYEK